MRLREQLGGQNKKIEEVFELVQVLNRNHDKMRLKLEEGLGEVRLEVREVRECVDSGVQRAGASSEGALSTVVRLERTVEGLKEEMWELDTNNRNNLVFYGIREDGASTSETAVRDIIRR